MSFLRVGLVSCLVLLALLPIAQAFQVYVAANSEECFFEHVYKGDKVVGSFAVAHGGYMDIDVKVYGPDNKIVYEAERQLDGTFQFKAVSEGVHRLCFLNTMSTISGKLVNFQLYNGDSLHKHDAAKKDSLSPLENSVLKTTEGLNGLKDEFTYMRSREERHSSTAESTNSRVLWWTAMNFVSLVAVAIVQVFFLRRLFEKTRKA